MAKIPHAIDKIQSHYGMVVIGSGYGGGIAASHLSRAGKNTCLFEQGKQFMSGDFPGKLGPSTTMPPRWLLAELHVPLFLPTSSV
jgi:cholesterol oxidase